MFRVSDRKRLSILLYYWSNVCGLQPGRTNILPWPFVYSWNRNPRTVHDEDRAAPWKVYEGLVEHPISWESSMIAGTFWSNPFCRHRSSIITGTVLQKSCIGNLKKRLRKNVQTQKMRFIWSWGVATTAREVFVSCVVYGIVLLQNIK